MQRIKYQVIWWNFLEKYKLSSFSNYSPLIHYFKFLKKSNHFNEHLIEFTMNMVYQLHFTLKLKMR